jgi:Ca2+-transporting ATPase
MASISPTWHTKSSDQALQELQVKPEQGLSPNEASQRLAHYGPNELFDKGTKKWYLILWEQVSAPLVLILVFAAILSAALGKYDSFIAITAIIVLNALLGLYQENKAEQAMAALKRMAAPLVRVRRDGAILDIPSREIVPGDVVLLEAGNVIPADSRLLEANNFQVQEASLTGESYPVEKIIKPIETPDLPLGDRKNMVYMGTSVTNGRGLAVVVNTGMKTELGRIADLIQNVGDEQTPLQKRMAEVGHVLLVVAILVMIVAGLIGLYNDDPMEDLLVNAVAIAVAVVPEGLLAVVTICLALGAQRMLQRKALIRKLPAVETLGSVTVICSDKTGTLTENRMTVTVMDVAGQRYSVTDFAAQETTQVSPTQQLLMAAGVLCNDASLKKEDGQSLMIGDPTEGALLVVAERFAMTKTALNQAFPRIGEYPFSSERKRMTTVHALDAQAVAAYLPFLKDSLGNAKYVAFTKGSADGMLDIATHVWDDGKVVPMTEEWRTRITETNNGLANEGLRVLGIAYHPVTDANNDGKWEFAEADEVFVGMVGIIDPPRAEVKTAVATCKAAGIRPVMITGDHPLTAKSIAYELGIIESKDATNVLTGYEMAKMTDQQIEDSVTSISVYARVSPEHKLKIVRGLQNKGNIVAMTGDGVNDAPALKQASIGVAMGITGTDVSKEASDMVIVDDNFATIVSAVEEGRTIYDNVRRFVKYLLASNTGELLVLLMSQVISGLTLPLTTLQILWMNLITDGIPALALSVEKAEPGAMKRSPYAPNESIFGRGMSRHILLVGLLMGGTGLALGYWAWDQQLKATNGELAWNTMVFFFLTVAQMGHALGVRSHRDSLFTIGLFTNPTLLIAVVSTILIQLGAIYLPFFNDLFETNPLTLEQLAICFVVSSVVFIGVELEKVFIRMGYLNA